MNISFKTLNDAIKKAPYPDRPGDLYSLRVERRINDLRLSFESPVDHDNQKISNEVIAYDVLTLVAAEYCRSKDDCWLEWEIEINERSQ